MDKFVSEDFHRFDNRIRVSRKYLEAPQLERYGEEGGPNLHEPEEEYWLIDLVRRCDPGDELVFLDIGAAIGYYTVLVRTHRDDARIIAIDGNKRFSDAFWNTLSANSIDTTGVDLKHLAVYPHVAEVQMVDKHFGSHVRQVHNAEVPDGQLRTVPAVSLPALIEDLAVPISICKMDVQTAELPILLHALPRLDRTLVKHWIVGTHGRGIHKRLLELFGESEWKVIHENPKPSYQPDGIIVAVAEDQVR